MPRVQWLHVALIGAARSSELFFVEHDSILRIPSPKQPPLLREWCIYDLMYVLIIHIKRPETPSLFGHSPYVISGELGKILSERSNHAMNHTFVLKLKLILLVCRAASGFYKDMELTEKNTDDARYKQANGALTSELQEWKVYAYHQLKSSGCEEKGTKTTHSRDTCHPEVPR